ncbi:MAG: hypothetical protein IJ881_06525 [Neisseriaceae bacterium]|nr:hypothetical protein [Neisseriaceae bacterium]MBR3424443.1 hypothetical protein [Neisseriaceae bacterium]
MKKQKKAVRLPENKVSHGVSSGIFSVFRVFGQSKGEWIFLQFGGGIFSLFYHIDFVLFFYGYFGGRLIYLFWR